MYQNGHPYVFSLLTNILFVAGEAFLQVTTIMENE